MVTRQSTSLGSHYRRGGLYPSDYGLRMISLLSKAVFPWAAGGMVVLVLGGFAKFNYDKRIELKIINEQQTEVIRAQAQWAEKLGSIILDRDLAIQELTAQQAKKEEEWSEVRETLEDTCVNAVHPDIAPWMWFGPAAPAPNRYFDGSTPPTQPASGV